MVNEKLKLDEKEIIKEYKSKGSVTPIAKRMRCDIRIIYKILKKNKIGMINLKPHKKDLDIENIKNLYISGLSCNDIAKRHSTSKSTIRNRLNKIGIDLSKNDKTLRDNKGKFIKGNNILELYGKKISKTQKRRLEENPQIIERQKRKHKETLQNNPILLEKLRTARLGKVSPMKGRKQSREARIKNGLAHLGRKDKRKGKNFEEIYGETKANEIKQKIKKTRAKQIFPQIDTKIEIKIQNFLKELGIEFFTHQYMKIEHGYQCDVFIPSMNMIIECDGDIFHFNPKKYKPNDKIFRRGMTAQEKWNLDEARTQELMEQGYNVIRLWESDIKDMSLEQFERRIN